MGGERARAGPGAGGRCGGAGTRPRRPGPPVRPDRRTPRRRISRVPIPPAPAESGIPLPDKRAGSPPGAFVIVADDGLHSTGYRRDRRLLSLVRPLWR
ncbi:hypothetical protein FRACA_710010 [Frankia canadensis]|uniref:Uncharacterized protein n=1 Tax=Frankia canadensis TaxID=1836972 RepID=A0A2I2L0P0_9ACTN|nr:hypothetical protein FRACA_710010 [Frankia canadensis]SOU58776.1 hypothetical protein FRACA_710010 [Frankia canadensis]